MGKGSDIIQQTGGAALAATSSLCPDHVLSHFQLNK